MKRFTALMLALLLLLCGALAETAEILCEDGIALTDELLIEYGLEYFAKDEVALYLHCFCELPPNYLTKREARSLGWLAAEGNLWLVAPGRSIGGDRFGNYEGSLPDEEGRLWYECDIDYGGGFRNSQRLLFSSDGLIYYTSDHYRSFTQLYDTWYFEDGVYAPEYEY